MKLKNIVWKRNTPTKEFSGEVKRNSEKLKEDFRRVWTMVFERKNLGNDCWKKKQKKL